MDKPEDDELIRQLALASNPAPALLGPSQATAAELRTRADARRVSADEAETVLEQRSRLGRRLVKLPQARRLSQSVLAARIGRDTADPACRLETGPAPTGDPAGRAGPSRGGALARRPAARSAGAANAGSGREGASGQPVLRVRPAPGLSERRGEGDVETASICRVREALLGGYLTFPADRQVASDLVELVPGAAAMAQADRAFTSRAVRAVVAAGVEQVLDLGCGSLSSAGSVHDTIVQAAPHVRSVHLDIDPFAAAHAVEVIAGSGRQDLATAFRADLRDPGSVFADRRLTRRLDLWRPTAVIVTGVLEHLDDDAVHRLVAAIRDTLVAGSYLAVTHPTSELHSEVGALSAVTGAVPRHRHRVRGLLAGWHFCPPGLVWASRWRPEHPEARANVDATGPAVCEPAQRYLLAALARKPPR